MRASGEFAVQLLDHVLRAELEQFGAKALDLIEEIEAELGIQGHVVGNVLLRLVEREEGETDASHQPRLIRNLPRLEVPNVGHQHVGEGEGENVGQVVKGRALPQALANVLKGPQHRTGGVQHRLLERANLLEHAGRVICNHVRRQKDPRVDSGGIRVVLHRERVDPQAGGKDRPQAAGRSSHHVRAAKEHYQLVKGNGLYHCAVDHRQVLGRELSEVDRRRLPLVRKRNVLRIARAGRVNVLRIVGSSIGSGWNELRCLLHCEKWRDKTGRVEIGARL